MKPLTDGRTRAAAAVIMAGAACVFLATVFDSLASLMAGSVLAVLGLGIGLGPQRS